MKETLVSLLQETVASLQSTGVVNQDLQFSIQIDRTKDKSHGDFASNLALTLAKQCGMPSRSLAELLVKSIGENDLLERVEIAGPGFINFYLKNADKLNIIRQIITDGPDFGRSNLGQGQKVLLEYVSCNPTGPLHVGHGRGAAFGATLANLLKYTGFYVCREYYVNDSGRQMSILAVSVWLRYLALCGEKFAFPANGYKGDYVNDISQSIYAKHSSTYAHSFAEIKKHLPLDEVDGGDKDEYIDALIIAAKKLIGEEAFTYFHQQALDSVISDIKEDLVEFGVEFDSWFSEKSLLDDGSIKKTMDTLITSGYTYESEGAVWFKSTAFGDEKDRVLVRANGQYTYITPDIAYHKRKFDRGFDKAINILGADHHGYIARLQAALQALGYPRDDLSIILVQFAILYRGNERVQMSTRSGSFVTLRELREEVGNDAARFFYVMRKSEQHMDFDLNLAKSESSDNPVYYIQYAHARISSVLRQMTERALNLDFEKGLQAIYLLNKEHELDLISILSRYPEIIISAAKFREPHQIAYYLRELATSLHSYYNAVQLICEDENLRSARICLLQAVRQVIRNGLDVLGVSSPESM
ncbi:MAG: arginine--tRNA ligase [Legionellales bacterium RIFCSPHIGHO2_12_FULL_35_11]|nr:MAG: arginine--tRNA ligase [Legionellales bacterium RIFCSPHIGHO2_12_FULL_35_11]